MAEIEGKSPASVPWFPLLAVLAAVAGLTALLPSRSARPPAPSETAVANKRNEVSARLWQDPLSVAWEAAAARLASRPAAKDPAQREFLLGDPSLAGAASKSVVGESPWFEELAKTYGDLREKSGKPPIVLVACGPNSPYAEDVERRVRDRAGVVHALAAENYLPDDSTRLKFAMVSGQAEDVLPFESFHSLDWSRKPPVLVVWLADDVIDDKGLLCQLAKLVGALAGGDEQWVNSPVPDLRVLGPSSSKQYRLMLESAAHDEEKSPLAILAPRLASTQIYSCTAEAPEEVLTAGIPWMNHDLGEGKRETISIEQRMRTLKASNFRFHRTIRPANELATALWHELAARRVGEAADVAVIAELDSIYGRSTTWAFLRARHNLPVDPKDFDLTEAREASSRIHTYTYMAGLDGALPKNAFGAEEPKLKDADNTAKVAAPTEDPTEGLSQVDYLRRLAHQLKEKNEELKAEGRELRAVAVLGSDIYDKLQILRTLRPELPNALFLTNNLDARFWHPDEWAETRNLLVASNFDVTPPENWRSETPPFRDSLQAAMYAATREALGNGLDGNRWRGRPLMFEIGRSGPVRLADLTQPVPGGGSPETFKLWRNIGCCLGLLAVLLVLLWPNCVPRKVLANPWPRMTKERFVKWPWRGLPPTKAWLGRLFRSEAMVPVALVLSFGLTALRYYCQAVPGAEPFALWDGISIWPGDFLRLCVLLLAAYFVVKTLHDLEKNRIELEKKFAIANSFDRPLLIHAPPPYRTEAEGVHLDPEDKKLRVSNLRVWERWWRDFWPLPEEYGNECDRVHVRHLWLRYQTWGRPRKRLGRALLLFALYFGALLLFRFALNEPNPDLPVRGTASVWSNRLLWASGLSYLFVTFLVLDATELNGRLIRDLNRSRSDWQLSGVLRRSVDFRFEDYRRALEPEDCADYLDIEFIARRSDVVNGLVYYPLVLLTLLLASRWSMTDQYPWPPATIIAYGISAALAIYCAIRLPIEANAARDKSLERLRGKLFARRVEEERGRTFPKSSAEALKRVVTQIETMNRGAFVGIWDQPVLRALLVPSGSAGLWALLESIPH